MGGGMVQDALSEIDIVKKIGDRLDAPQPEIKVRCQKCQHLNAETAKFCNQWSGDLIVQCWSFDIPPDDHRGG
jgi:hypothetical protein